MDETQRPRPPSGPVKNRPSDQPPGEGVVQVNDDAAAGKDSAPAPNVDDQHPHGG